MSRRPAGRPFRSSPQGLASTLPSCLQLLLPECDQLCASWALDVGQLLEVSGDAEVGHLGLGVLHPANPPPELFYLACSCLIAAAAPLHPVLPLPRRPLWQ